MTLRHDAPEIKMIAKEYGLEVAKSVQRLPFFWIPESIEDEIYDDAEDGPGKYAKWDYSVLPTEYEEVTNLLPFDEFTVKGTNLPWFRLHHRGQGVWTILEISNEPELKWKKVLPFVPMLVTTINVAKAEVEGFTIEGTVLTSLVPSDRLTKKERIRFEEANKHSEEKFKNSEARLQFMVGVVSSMLAYFKWAESKHMVRVRNEPSQADRKAKKKGDLKPWTRTDKAHYIYLDAPQTEAEHPSKNDTPEEEKRKVRGHHRRAHFRTLRHPKFRHHPDYMKPVRRKATWVGPRDWVVEGTIYTLVDDNHEGDDDDES